MVRVYLFPRCFPFSALVLSALHIGRDNTDSPQSRLRSGIQNFDPTPLRNPKHFSARPATSAAPNGTVGELATSTTAFQLDQRPQPIWADPYYLLLHI